MNLVELRHLLHLNAEVSFKEWKTKELLTEELKIHRGTLIELQDTPSFLYYYDFGRKKTVMIRSEMDGLAIEEKTKKEYASKNDGVMHACGHDGHMAILCGVSRCLSEINECPVNVLLVFQSAEESGAGAQKVIDHPSFAEICPDEAIALHVMPQLSYGKFFTKYGVIVSGGREIDLRWNGKSAHCAHPEQGKDALKKGIMFLEKSYLQYFEDGFLSFNKISAGQVRNQIADLCVLEGTMRFKSRKSENEMLNWLKENTRDASLSVSDGTPVLSNSFSMVQCAVEAGAELLKDSLWICDDFARYAECIPSVYVLMGMDASVDLHHERFDFCDDLIETGVDFFMKMIRNHEIL